MDQQPSKDFWDKFSTISTFLSTVVVAVGTFFISQVYQQKQAESDERLKRIDLVEQLIPQLSSTDSLKNKSAVFVLSELGYDSLAAEIAVQFKTPGSMAALEQLSNNSPGLDSTRRKYFQRKWETFHAQFLLSHPADSLHGRDDKHPDAPHERADNHPAPPVDTIPLKRPMKKGRLGGEKHS